MRLQIIAMGRMKEGSLKELCKEYQKRLTYPLAFRELESKIKGAVEEIRLNEQNLILNVLPQDSYVVLLDEKGENLSSDEMSFLMKQTVSENLVFLIGGTWGVTQLVRSKAHKILSFGRVTWPHMLVRVMLMEQLYRAQQILKNHPYHKR